jgi:trehalose/maltose hydrolase-like predicted phosphorylase
MPPSARRPARVTLSLLACALLAAAPQASATPRAPTAAPSPARSLPSSPGTDGGWTLTSHGIDPKDSYHAYVGNGYLGQRVAPNGTGYTASGEKTGWPMFTPRYDGAFVAGLYAHKKKLADGKQVVAALPTWSTLNVATGGKRGETFSSGTPRGRVSHYRQSLLPRQGLVRTSLTWTASDGRATDLTFEVMAERDHPHVGAVRMSMTPHWSGTARVTDVLDGRGAREVTQTGGGARGGGPDGKTMDVAFRTDGTKVGAAMASTLRPGPEVRTKDEQTAAAPRKLTAKQGVSFSAQRGRTYHFTKHVGVDTARTSHAPADSAVAISRRAARRGWGPALATHAAAWERLWRSDIEVGGHPELQKWLRSAQYGLLSSTRRGSSDSIAPAGLSSDNYAGLIFWDAETWMYPGLLATHPQLAKAVLDYRYRTRTGAARNARKLGYKGLFYGWTAGSNDDLWKECHSWDPPHCATQNHLQSDIALATWQYYLATHDTHWLRARGWPVLKGIADFWTSRATRNHDGSYSVKNVAGPDEYSNGVDDAVFTNAGAATSLRNAAHAAQLLGKRAPSSWTSIAGKLRIPFSEKNGVFQQYAGYKGSLIKQADTVLLQYPLEWPMKKKTATKTLDYYASRTDPDGPAMTDSVHAIDAASNDEPGCSTYTYLKRSIEPFVRGPYSLFSEARGAKAGARDPLAGSPAQDFLTGKGGFLQVFTNGLTGQRMREDKLELDPMLPPQLSEGVTLKGLHWQGRTYDIALAAHQTTVSLREGKPLTLGTPHGQVTVSRGAPAVLKTRRPDLSPTGNLARCQPAKGSTQQPGMYAESAVDGSAATSWTPNSASGAGSLTIRLKRPARGGAITPKWTAGTEPKSHTTEVSADGAHWRTWHAGEAARGSSTGAGDRPYRYVRISVTAKSAKKPAGVAELSVTGRR